MVDASKYNNAKALILIIGRQINKTHNANLIPYYTGEITQTDN